MSYPLKFQTIYKDKLWGGNKINTFLGKDFGNLPNCGESWELSGVPGDVSIVSNGPWAGKDLKSVLAAHGSDVLGQQIYEKCGNDFPLLIKFIDASQDLSIQVHPDDALALKRHNSLGKTEMWYVLQADPDARLISGFNRPITAKEYLAKFESGQILEILNQEFVQADDVFFLPAGRIHTIGKGLLIAEIQQTSDITYRIYDFDRKDAHGNKRTLHVSESLDAIDYQFYPEHKTQYTSVDNQRISLVDCDYFTTNKLGLIENSAIKSPEVSSFKIYICLEGDALISGPDEETEMVKGETLLVPASMTHFQIKTNHGTVLLETYIRNGTK